MVQKNIPEFEDAKKSFFKRHPRITWVIGLLSIIASLVAFLSNLQTIIPPRPRTIISDVSVENNNLDSYNVDESLIQASKETDSSFEVSGSQIEAPYESTDQSSPVDNTTKHVESDIDIDIEQPALSALVTIATGKVHYLESDIKSADSQYINKYPESGSFSILGTTYFRGITNMYDKEDVTVRFNITNQGFSRLTGLFGRVSGSGIRTLIIIGDGALLAGYELTRNGTPLLVDVAIPSNVQQISIRIQHIDSGDGSASGIFAFADAYFSDSSQSPLPIQTHPPEVNGAAYLESDIKSANSQYINSYPERGSFSMSRTTYFRGITNMYDREDGTVRFNITNHGFSRLTGLFGRVSGSGIRTLTIIGDGALLAGYELTQSGTPIKVDVSIPSSVQQIDIRIQHIDIGGTASGFFALADAYFSSVYVIEHP